MKDIYIITGANGHLGSTIIRALKKQIHSHSSRIREIRGLILPGEQPPFKEDNYVRWYYGDVTDIPSLVPLLPIQNTTVLLLSIPQALLTLPPPR